MQPDALDAAEIEQFLARGFVVVRGALDRDLARAWVARSWVRNGADPLDRSTWPTGRVAMPAHESRPVAEIAPRAYRAICQLVGGEDRIAGPLMWRDGFIVNFPALDQPWLPPSSPDNSWHKDGDFFRHFLDSPEQGLLTIVLWDDVRHRGAPTYVACDSVGVAARHLARHPEGQEPPHTGTTRPFPVREAIAECRDFIEATGEAGDVYLLHPFMVHSASINHLDRARFITNPPVSLREPMRFDRPRAADHSPVERAILRALGVDRFPFTATSRRCYLEPPRVANQRRMREAELERLRTAGLTKGQEASS